MLIGVLVSINLSSCSGNDEPLPEPILNEEGKSYVVSLNLGGEYTSVTEEPLSRANEVTPEKYYGINVYCMKTDGTETSYSRYAYGVFDNVADMKVTLLGGYKYKFECTSVTEDNDKIGYQSVWSNGTSTYNLIYPFITYYSSYYGTTGFPLLNLNSFIINQERNLYRIKYGTSSVKIYEDSYIDKYYPRLNRFYGELEDYIPSDGATATIPMKRTVFGIKVVVNGVPDGSLEWYDNKDYRINYDYGLTFSCENCTGPDQIECNDIFTSPEVYDCWKSEEPYTQDFTIYFVWTRANGYKQYFDKKITVKRNVMTTITVNLKGGANDVAIGVNEDNTPMDNEDISVEYDGGNLNDTPVDPEE